MNCIINIFFVNLKVVVIYFFNIKRIRNNKNKNTKNSTLSHNGQLQLSRIQ